MVIELEKLLQKEWFAAAGHRDLVIYHYTTAAGLIGILQTNSIRGTSAAFLNDTSEISYGVSICKGVIDAMSEENGPDREFLNKVEGIFEFESAPTEVFITSFTTADDVLGQWRGYGSEAGRYSIGFRVSQFSERDVLRLPQEVDYDPESQRKRVRYAINLGWEYLKSKPDDRATLFQVIGSLGLYLRRLVCIFKHPGFREEREWRSVSSFDERASIQHVSFEAVEGVPRPYLTMLQGSRVSHHLPVVEIRVGAAKRQDFTVFAVALLLRRLGYDDASVTRSQIPLAP